MELTALILSLHFPPRRFFATGSDDGTICIWKFREQGWVALKLKIPKEEVYK